MKHALKTRIQTSVFTFASALLLAACGGGSGGGGGSTGLSAATQPLLPANTQIPLEIPASVRTQLTGSALRSGGANAAFEIAQVTGTFDNNTQALVLNDGQFRFADLNGPDGAGLHRSGTAVASLPDLSASPFDFVTPYAQSYTLNGQTFDSLGVVGLASDPATFPATTKASFTGFASGAVGSFVTQQVEGFTGDSTIEADFGNGLVDVTLDSLVTNNNAALASGFDRIRVDNMTIQGSGFSGGTFSTTRNGVVVNVTGANTVSNAQGHFYGPFNRAPDEVGGTVTSEGSTRLIGAVFVAD